MAIITSVRGSENYPAGSMGDFLEKHSAHGRVEKCGDNIVYHLNLEDSQGEEVLLEEKDHCKYLVSKDLLSQKKGEIVEFIEQHPALFFAPLIDTLPPDKVKIKEMQYCGGGSYGKVYHVTKIALDNIEHQTDLILKTPGDDSDSIPEMRSEIDFIHELHQRLSDEERAKFFPNVHEVTYKGQIGYLAERFDDNLENYLDSDPSLEEKIEIANQLIEQLAILSKYNGIYTDIKLKNVLIKKSKPIKVVLADFGNCHFVEKRDKISPYGFTYTYRCREDHLFSDWKKSDDKTLKEYADQHEARTLGLLLSALFGGDDYPDIYYQSELPEYFNSCPLGKLKEKNPNLYDTIKRLLGIDSAQFKPLEAWEWNLKSMTREFQADKNLQKKLDPDQIAEYTQNLYAKIDTQAMDIKGLKATLLHGLRLLGALAQKNEIVVEAVAARIVISNPEKYLKPKSTKIERLEAAMKKIFVRKVSFLKRLFHFLSSI